MNNEKLSVTYGIERREDGGTDLLGGKYDTFVSISLKTPLRQQLIGLETFHGTGLDHPSCNPKSTFWPTVLP